MRLFEQSLDGCQAAVPGDQLVACRSARVAANDERLQQCVFLDRCRELVYVLNSLARIEGCVNTNARSNDLVLHLPIQTRTD